MKQRAGHRAFACQVRKPGHLTYRCGRIFVRGVVWASLCLNGVEDWCEGDKTGGEKTCLAGSAIQA